MTEIRVLPPAERTREYLLEVAEQVCDEGSGAREVFVGDLGVLVSLCAELGNEAAAADAAQRARETAEDLAEQYRCELANMTARLEITTRALEDNLRVLTEREREEHVVDMLLARRRAKRASQG